MRVCGISGCLLKITRHKKGCFVTFTSKRHSYSIYHLSYLCLHEWESFSVILQCENVMLGLNKNVPSVSVYAVKFQVCFARVGHHLVVGNPLNFLIGQSDDIQTH